MVKETPLLETSESRWSRVPADTHMGSILHWAEAKGLRHGNKYLESLADQCDENTHVLDFVLFLNTSHCSCSIPHGLCQSSPHVIPGCFVSAAQSTHRRLSLFPVHPHRSIEYPGFCEGTVLCSGGFAFASARAPGLCNFNLNTSCVRNTTLE